MSEESYVVRIYRKERIPGSVPSIGPGRRSHDGITVAGTVEDVERGERRYFRDIEELWAILSRPARPVAGRRAGKDAPEK